MGAEAAIIGLVGALLGVAISNMFVLLLEKKRRYERQLDLVFAIHAEISAGLGANQKLLTPEEMAYALADQTPFQTPDDTDFVFLSIKGDITLLPNPVIHCVVQYYRHAMQTNLMTLDLRHEAFEKQGSVEKRKFMSAILEVAMQQQNTGFAAIKQLEDYAQGCGRPIPALYKPIFATAALPERITRRGE